MKTISEAQLKELAALSEIADEDINYSDIPVTHDEGWAKAERGRFYRPI